MKTGKKWSVFWFYQFFPTDVWFIKNFVRKTEKNSRTFTKCYIEQFISVRLKKGCFFDKKTHLQKNFDFLWKNPKLCCWKIRACWWVFKKIRSMIDIGIETRHLQLLNRGNTRHMYHKRHQLLCRLALCMSWSVSGKGKKCRPRKWKFSYQKKFFDGKQKLQLSFSV